MLNPSGMDAVFLGSARCAGRAANAQNAGDDMKYGISGEVTVWRLYGETRCRTIWSLSVIWDGQKERGLIVQHHSNT